MQMKPSTRMMISFLLTLSVFTTGCNAQWLNVALADLPVLTQMALNIASLVATMQSGKQIDPAEQAAIQKISAEASRDLNLLQTLYNEYKANPVQSKLQEIDSTIAEINQNLPALLQAAHISSPMLATRITAGVNLIVTTVSSFAAMMPQTQARAARRAARTGAIPTAGELKKQWNREVCGASDGAGFASASCELR
jgi:hypothetical protein